MNNTIWACDYLGKSELDSDFQAHIDTRDWQSFNRLIHMIVNGHPIEAREIPKTVQSVKTKPGKLKHVSNMGLFAYAPEVVDLLKNFDLGAAKFHEIEFLAKDGAPLPDLAHSYVEYGNVKTSFSIEHSRNTEELPTHNNPGLVNYRYPPGYVRDDDLALTAECLNGPDIWVEKHLIRMVFVSDAVAQALRKAKLDKPFFLRRCRLV